VSEASPAAIAVAAELPEMLSCDSTNGTAPAMISFPGTRYWKPSSTVKSSGFPPLSQAAIAMVSGCCEIALGALLFPSSAVLQIITMPCVIASLIALVNGVVIFWRTTRLSDMISTSLDAAQRIAWIVLASIQMIIRLAEKKHSPRLLFQLLPLRLLSLLPSRYKARSRDQ
jgi:hypothetical protein